MFTGFASENTPAIQIWEFSQTGAGTTRVGLADDCAPIQFIKTGGSGTAINLYLPTAPIEGKTIKVVNANYSSTPQQIAIWPSDSTSQASLIAIGAGQTLDLCYSKNFITSPAGIGDRQTGWIFLNQSPINAWNFNAIVLGGNNNSAERSRAAVIGGSSNTASGQSSGVFAGGSNTASGTSSVVVGGDSSTASGNNSAVMGGFNNTASGLRSAAIGGTTNQATAQYAATIGGDTIQATNNYAFAAGGTANQASGINSAVVGGNNSTANSTVSIVINGGYGTTRSIIGNTVSPASYSPISSASGVTQSALLVLGVATTDATATRLRSNTSAATTTNQVILPNNSAYVFQGTCIANVTGGSTTSGWEFQGVIKRGANAASTALVAAVTPTVIAQDALASTWVLAITADTTNGGIAVTVTGAAATTIRWVSKIETTEVTY